MDIEFYQMLFIHLLMIMWFLSFVDVAYRIDFAYAEPFFWLWNESNCIMVYDSFHVFLD